MSLRLAAIFAAMALAGCASLVKPDVSAERAALREGQYALDPDHAALVFKIDHLGFSRFIGRFETFSASLDFDQANPSAARVEAVIDVASLDVANDEFSATLAGPNWFDADAFPQAVFRSTAVEVTGESAGVMTGELTLHAVTQPVRLDVVFNGGGRDRLRGGAYIVGFSAAGEISRSAFGVDRFKGLISDDVMIEIEAEFVRR